MIKPVRVALEVYKGATFRRNFTWTADPEGANPIDITGATARMQFRENVASSDIVAELTTENGGITLGGATGEIELYLSNTDTTAITPQNGVYDLEIVMPDGDVNRLMEGTAVFVDEVTR